MHGERKRSVLVTGGAGFIGRELVNRLSKNKISVICFYHQKLPQTGSNIFPVCTDMSSAELMGAPLRNIDTVYHLAWKDSFIGPKENVSWNLENPNLPKNIQALKNLILAMEQQNVKRLVFMSALGASRQSTHPYLREKYFAEFLILNSKIPEKIILRPSFICSDDIPNDRFFGSILRSAPLSRIHAVPKSKSIVYPVPLVDFVDALVRMSEIEVESPLSIIEVNGEESFTIEQLFRVVLGNFRKKHSFGIKGDIGNKLFTLFEKESKKTNGGVSVLDYLNLHSNENEALFGSAESKRFFDLSKNKLSLSLNKQILVGA